MPNYCIQISYDGTDLSGWQIQPNALSVQQLIEEALYTVIRTPTKVMGSGRTDAGVHAIAQVAHFKLENPIINIPKLLISLNGILPKTVRIHSLYPALDSFHARYSAIGKKYQYWISNTRYQNPLFRLYRWQISRPIDRGLLKQATQILQGEHDFTAFANSGTPIKNGIRHLYEIKILEEKKTEICLEFYGSGFLYKMVRNLTGSLISVAIGSFSLNKLKNILDSKDRKLAGAAAPAHGLCLTEVFYKNSVSNNLQH